MIPYSQLGKTRRKMTDVIPLDVPFTIFIEPTNYCNFRCVQCPHGLDNYAELAGPMGNMDMKCFEKLVADLNDWREQLKIEGTLLKVIRLYLEGEPFVNPEIVDMLRVLKENNIAERIEIITNGSLLNQEICEKLVEYELDYITISIYAIEDEKHRQATRTQVAPVQIRENVKLLRQIRDTMGKEKPFIYTKIIDTYSLEENQKFRDYYENIADEICIEKPMNWNSSEEVDFIENLYGKEKAQTAREELGQREYRRVCPYPFHTLSIKSNGDVLVCCVDWQRNTKVGNILEKTLHDIWNGTDLYELRKLHVQGQRNENKSCDGCELFFKFAVEDNLDALEVDEEGNFVKNEKTE